MCGLFTILGDKNVKGWRGYEQTLTRRGPEERKEVKIEELDMTMVFHRLKINGNDLFSSQPFMIDDCVLMCNGEIYNHEELKDMYNITTYGQSDCEVIIYLYKMFGFEKTLNLLDGVFSIILYDNRTKSIWMARDRYGVRQLFMGYNSSGFGTSPNVLAIASEAKALVFLKECVQIRPGSMIHICAQTKRIISEIKWFEPIFPANCSTEEDIKRLIRYRFEQSVKKRMMSDRPIGCLLSGGFDSSIIASVLSRNFSNPSLLNTFSIGLKDSPDLIAARSVAEFLGTTHHEILCTKEEGLNSIGRTIYTVGSYDVTTIRASVWHLKLCEWIRDNTDIKVVYSGEYADEMCMSYLYGANAPSSKEFQEESLRLLSDIGYFDNLRGDHCISACGLESRIPFADYNLMELILSTSPKLKMFGSNGRIEKQLFRESFVGFLPDDILFRRKNGFSDSVSPKTESWSVIIQKFVEDKMSDREFEYRKVLYPEVPFTKEAHYYRKIYNHTYPSSFKLTPYQWLPRWSGNVTDPSARVLDIYEAD